MTRPGPLSDICLLIVDDNPDVRAVLQTGFEDLGAVVVTAESADEAVFLFQRLRPQVVLTDIAMPAHDGFWLLRQLRTLELTQPSRTPVMAMTALASAAVRATFDEWIAK